MNALEIIQLHRDLSEESLENFPIYSANPCKWPKLVDHRLKQGFFLLRLSVEVRIE